MFFAIMAVSVIAGLGNPGLEYRDTRHNVGLMAVERLATSLGADWKTQKRLRADLAKVRLGGHEVWLVRSHTYMNESGESVGAVLRYHKIPASDLAAVYDEINLEPGRCKITVRGSAGGHNGVASLLQHVGPDFVRVRVGVGGKPRKETDLKNWVLGKFSPEEKKLIESRLDLLLVGLETLVREGAPAAMKQINTRSTYNNHEPNRDEQALPRDLHP